MRIAGFVMIAIGLSGLLLSLIDLETTGAFRTEQSTVSKSDDQAVSDPAVVPQAVADQRASVEAQPVEQAKASDAEGGRSVEAATANAPADSKGSVVTAGNPANVKVFQSQDDAEPSAPTLWADIAAGQEVVSEDSTYANFLLTLSEPSDRSVVIIFSTIDLSAIDQEDYRSQRGTVTFKPGVVSAEIRTPLVDDDIEEHDEQFAIVLNGAPNTVNFRNRRAAVTIKDND